MGWRWSASLPACLVPCLSQKGNCEEARISDKVEKSGEQQAAEADVKGFKGELGGVGALDKFKLRWSQTPSCYAMTGWRRTESGRPAANMRFSTATPTAASVCWAAKPRARSRGPISAL